MPASASFKCQKSLIDAWLILIDLMGVAPASLGTAKFTFSSSLMYAAVHETMRKAHPSLIKVLFISLRFSNIFSNFSFSLVCLYFAATCNVPLGMESGAITDAQITASSAHDTGFVGPQHARWVAEIWFILYKVNTIINYIWLQVI